MDGNTPSQLVQLLGDDRYVETVPDSNVKNGKLIYIKLDVDKQEKIFYNLQNILNATAGEANKTLPIQFLRGGEPIPLNETSVSLDGTYPDGKNSFHVTGTLLSNSSPVINFTFPAGLFQDVGNYVFAFTIENKSTGIKETSHNCFFNVTQSITTLAVDWNEGVSPFDSDYSKWKAKINAQMSTLQDTLDGISKTASTLADTVSAYTKTVNSTVDNAFNKKLGQANNWTAKQTMSEAEIGNLTVDDWFDAKKDLTVEQALHVKGSADLPSNVTFANPVLKFENNNLAAGLFPCEGYWYADLAGGGKGNVACWGVNGVSGKYFSFRKFRYTGRDGDANSALMEIHADASIPTSAFGKPIIQFNNANLEGVDGTHFMFGGHELSFKASENALYCWGYALGNSNNNECNDATMV